MKNYILLLLVVVLISAESFAKSSKKHRRPKLNYEDAKELCLTTLGASIEDQVLDNCIKNAMKSGKAVSTN